MPYSNRAILVDANGKPIPQYFDPVADSYQPLYGRNGATRVELYDASGNPITVTSGKLAVRATEIENLLSGVLDVHVADRDAHIDAVLLTSTPLGAGASYTAPVLDLTQPPGVEAIGYIVFLDQLLKFEIVFGDSNSLPSFSVNAAEFVVRRWSSGSGTSVAYVPPFRPLGTRMQVRLTNPTGTAQSTLRVYELRYRRTNFIHAQNLRAVLAQDLAIRDTNTHSFSSDPQYIFRLARTPFGGGKVPIFIDNQLNQSVDVTINIGLHTMFSVALGTVNVPAGSRRVVTNQDFPGLDVPSEQIQLTFRCTTAPTSGVISAYVDTVVGGAL